jgi:hypothetical protein
MMNSGRDPDRHFEDIVQDLHRERRHRQAQSRSRRSRPKSFDELNRSKRLRWTIGVAIVFGLAVVVALLVPA